PLAPPPPPQPPPPTSYLLYQGGITHSLLGAVAEMAALSALAGLVLHWHARRTGTRPAPWRWIAALVVATVAGHLWLDWQGSYGVRPLLPWNTRWYSADWIAIVDPFFWIVPLPALAWGARRHWLPALGSIVTLLGLIALVGWRGAVGPCRAISRTRPWCGRLPRRRGAASRSSRAFWPRKSTPAGAGSGCTCGTLATTPWAPWNGRPWRSGCDDPGCARRSAG